MLKRFVRAGCGIAALACLMYSTGFAQPADKRTTFTFSGPVALPGITLPAGQYLFRLADPSGDRKVVQVLSADGRKPYGMFFSMSADRAEPPSTPEVRFMETGAGMPAAIRTWWYPGERSGYEFIYPREQARRLAQGAREPVLTTQAQTTTTAQTNTGNLARISSTGRDSDVSATGGTTAPPTGTNQRGEIAPSSISVRNDTVATPAEPGSNASAAQSSQRTRRSLPQTASSIPLVALIGFGALCAGLGLRMQRRHSGA
jgi:hypothetical protein